MPPHGAYDAGLDPNQPFSQADMSWQRGPGDTMKAALRKLGSSMKYGSRQGPYLTLEPPMRQKARVRSKALCCCLFFSLLLAAGAGVFVILWRKNLIPFLPLKDNHASAPTCSAPVASYMVNTFPDSLPHSALRTTQPVPYASNPSLRLLVKFYDVHDPFVSHATSDTAAALRGSAGSSDGGRRLLQKPATGVPSGTDKKTAVTTATVLTAPAAVTLMQAPGSASGKAVYKAWQEAQGKVNGWFNGTASTYLPTDIPVAQQSGISRFYYAAYLSIYIIEATSQDALNQLYSTLTSLRDKPMNKAVQWVQLDEISLSAAATVVPPPNDALLQYQWAATAMALLDTPSQTPGAWNQTLGDDAIVVAVLDSGVDTGHPDLQDNMYQMTGEVLGSTTDADGNGYAGDLYGWNFVSDSADLTDDLKHGTYIAGIIGATSNNGIDVTAVSPHVRILSLKVLDQNGRGRVSDIVQAVQYALAANADITCHAYNGYSAHQGLADVVSAAQTFGQLLVAAAGNDGQSTDGNLTYPAGYDNDVVLSVGASNEKDCWAGFSNYGKKSVDLAAPGQDIVGLLQTTPDGGATIGSGTSAAAAHTSGVAALVLAALKSNNMTYERLGVEVKKVILGNVDASPNFKDTTVSGGRLNAAKAVHAALGL